MIKFVVFDFDGVFTDGKITFDDNNNIIKNYNVKDGLGIKLLKNKNINIGCISGFKENNSQRNILDHLDIDYISMGDKNKKQTLISWCEELNITLDEVAYMGDDINDIEIMDVVKIIGCPKDAVNEVKELSNFISNKNGGYGCIREFCEFLLENFLDLDCLDKIKNEIKNEFNYQINSFELNNINKLAEIINDCEKNIYFIGIGKSGNMAKHCSDLLKSISYKSSYLEYTNLLHGDLGILESEDIVILFSNSGNTLELVNIIKYIKCQKLIGICSNENSKFNELCDETIIIPFKNEISGEINKIPTNSCMSQLLFSNILVSILKKNININNYKNNHPFGQIGKNLLKIKDVLINDYPKLLLNEKIELSTVLLEMTKYKIGCCFFVNKNDELMGILTDGDIRRLLINNSLNFIDKTNINENFYYETDLEKYVCDCNLSIFFPILENNKIIGIVKN